MRVENPNVGALGGGGAFDGVAAVGPDSRGYSGIADKISSDVVKLSNASNLVALAGQITSPERATKVAGLAAQLRSGQYQPGDGEIGQAILRDLSAGNSR